MFYLKGIKATQGFWEPAHIAQFEDLVLDKNFMALYGNKCSVEEVYLTQLTSEGGVY